jgi:hypothetical protein
LYPPSEYIIERGISGHLPKANNLSLPFAVEMAAFPRDVHEYMP